MQHENAETISQVVCDVLEQLAFVFADSAEQDELPPNSDDLLAVSMDISGAASGRLTVVSGPEVCLELAGNLMGLEPDEVSGEQASLALMELANVLCGRLLTELAGVEPVFDLAPPTPIAEPSAAWTELSSDDSAVYFLADDCPMLVRLELDQVLQQAA